jgi:hypothetical protein
LDIEKKVWVIQQFGNNMTSLQVLVIASLFASAFCCAEEVDIGSGTFSLPAGWKHFPSEEHAMTPRSGSFRDATGAIWIHYVYEYSSLNDLQKAFSEWLVDKEGESNGFSYRLIRKTEKSTIPNIYFPDLKTYFVPRTLQVGYLDVQESFRMGTLDRSGTADQKLASTIRLILDSFKPHAKK